MIHALMSACFTFYVIAVLLGYPIGLAGRYL